MKLVEILAKELNEWPNGVKNLTQSATDSEVFDDDLVSCILSPRIYLSTRHGESELYPIVTKKQWQIEREKINKQKEKSVSKDGWIRHRGGKCKVDGDVMVEVRLRDGNTNRHRASELGWNHYGYYSDIMAYRISKQPERDIETEIKEGFMSISASKDRGEPTEIELSATMNCTEKPLTAVDEVIAKQVEFNALGIRDEIKERKDEIEVNQKRIAELVEKLRSEGFALIEGESEEDMSDPHNWKAGDIVEVTGTSLGFTGGCLYSLRADGVSEWGSVLIAEDDEGSKSNGWNPEFFKFHHRPK